MCMTNNECRKNIKIKKKILDDFQGIILENVSICIHKNLTQLKSIFNHDFEDN